MAYFEEKVVQPIVITARCECGGTLEHDGVVLTSYPLQYPHKCNKCGKAQILDYQYPKVRYVDV